jgi:pyruvate formate lyase activating enzyme
MERELDHSPKVPESAHPGRWWHAIEDERIQCDLCPRDCKLHEGQRGACFVRQNLGGQMVLTTYGRSSGFCIDPIEKKPLNHFYPGSSILSFGTAGCNLACKFCQNWDISKSKDMDRLLDAATPEGIAAAAVAYGAQSVAFTYNDPVIFAEYAIDTAVPAMNAASRRWPSLPATSIPNRRASSTP